MNAAQEIDVVNPSPHRPHHAVDEPVLVQAPPVPAAAAQEPPKLRVEKLNAWYGPTHAIRDVSLTVPPRSVMAAIGPSGCGKSTFLRCLNRMHELVPGARSEGGVFVDGEDLYARGVDPVHLRRR
ncbi:MAG TPA: ATP-binding cassette domain-containing protein, partial [Anaeromyxobacteraceae bacterium]|nr:ATP-binding cassette domain-containing protein [Anaeromyxobacteraceae bacterium]